MKFSDLGLDEALLRAVTESGYDTPTPIQADAIPVILQGRDVLGCAQTGTGKTASFTLPMIEILSAGRARARMPRSLILAPTRELAAQVAQNFEKYGKYHKLTMALLVGGESMSEQMKKLDRGVHVLIATPGRLIDLIERGTILLTDIKILVLDECDRMLDMGFIPDIEQIVGRLPKIRQTLMFSATLPKEIRRLADAFLIHPREISVAPPASPAATVEQSLLVVEPRAKREVLRRLLIHETVRNALIFCNRKRDVAALHKVLQAKGFNVGALHGDMSQPARTETLDRFIKNEIKLLVCSDVAARGLDIKGLSHVFNFDLPMSAEDYVHRIGRTGRAGSQGRAISIATPEDGKYVAAIEGLIGREIPRQQLEDFAEAELEAEEDYRGRRRRGGTGSRDSRSRTAAPRRQAEKAEKTRETEEAEEAGQSEKTERPAPKAPKRAGGGGRREEPARHNADSVVGFGDDQPAFFGRSSSREQHSA